MKSIKQLRESNIEDTDHEKMMTHHHELAHAALKKNDLDAYHHHLDQKYMHAVKRDEMNAKKPVKAFEQTVNEARAADSYTTAANSATEDARRSRTSSILHSRAANAHRDASEAHSRKIDALVKSGASADQISHHEAQVKKHDQQATVHRYFAHRNAAKKITESTPEYQVHRVGVTVSDPNHYMVTKRKEMAQKFVRVTAKDEPHALERAKSHFQSQGLKVHDAWHHSIIKESEQTDHGVNVNEALTDACWKGYEAIGMKMKNGKKVPNCVPKEGSIPGKNIKEESVDEAKVDLDESVHSVKAAKFSQKAKLHPSISTHVRASDSHAKAASSYEKKIAAHIKSGGESSELKPLENMAKHHNRSSVLHRFMAHRLMKQGIKEAAEIAVESADDKLNLKITKHSQLALNAGKRGDTAAQKYHLGIVTKLKAGSSNTVKEGSEYDDEEQEEIIMAKGQLLKIVDMAKDLSESIDDQDELEPWIQVKITTAYNQLDDIHSYVEYSQDLYDDQPEAEKEFATEEVNSDVASKNDAKELARMQMLVRLGLLDRLKLNTVTRAIKKLDNNTPITTIAEKDVLFELLQNLIAAITSDESVFKKVKFNVANQ